jgi:hypothetical protein
MLYLEKDSKERQLVPLLEVTATVAAEHVEVGTDAFGG